MNITKTKVYERHDAFLSATNYFCDIYGTGSVEDIHTIVQWLGDAFFDVKASIVYNATFIHFEGSRWEK